MRHGGRVQSGNAALEEDLVHQRRELVARGDRLDDLELGATVDIHLEGRLGPRSVIHAYAREARRELDIAP